MKQFDTALQAYLQGGIIAYPTEAVFGLGCDPDNINALKSLLALKQRPIEKGLILLASSYQQLQPYLDLDKIPAQLEAEVLARWPNSTTQILPAAKSLSPFLTGRFSSIAVRITNQQDVVELCQQTNKPIVSTSANLSGQVEAKTWQEVIASLGTKVDYLIKGQTLGHTKPSTIIDALSGDIIRT